MKLVAIYNVWDDWDMLYHSLKRMNYPLVDGRIIIGSTTSNYGEYSKIPSIYDNDIDCYQYFGEETQVYKFEPDLKLQPSLNETNKRNFGLQKAIENGYTHFLMMDSDEVYEAEPFLKEKERFKNSDLQGLVCGSQVYFKSPKLTIGMDTTRVTFIHKITPQLKFEFNKHFPFAWDKMAIRIDPTRSLNINSGVEWSPIICHHMSWVRKDYDKKIRNSTARPHLERSSIREDLLLAKEGYFCKFYQKTLIRASVDFNIPEFNVHEDIQPLAPESH